MISLLPSATEIVFALGLGDRLVGRSHECDYPEGLERLPVCSSPRYRSDGTSPDINREVLNILKEALSIYRIDVDVIRNLRPTHILTQSLCAVCAVSTDEIRGALLDCLHLESVEYVDVNPKTLEDVLASIGQVAAALGVVGEGDRVVERMRIRFDAVRRRVGGVVSQPTVACIEWIEPLMTAGHWIKEFIPIAGGRDVFADAVEPWVSYDELRHRDPEVIVVAPCGFSVERGMENMRYLTGQPGWGGLRAVLAGRVYVADGSHYFSRPGPRLTDSLEMLAGMIHPGVFPPVNRGVGWTAYPL